MTEMELWDELVLAAARGGSVVEHATKRATEAIDARRARFPTTAVPCQGAACVQARANVENARDNPRPIDEAMATLPLKRT